MLAYFEAKRGLIAVNATTRLEKFEALFRELTITELTLFDMDIACDIYAARRQHGLSIEDADILIAAQVISRGYTLVTNNTKHFEGIDGLRLTNWAV